MPEQNIHCESNQGLDVSSSLNYDEHMLNVRERRAAKAHADLEALVADAGLGRAAAILDVYESTVQRWLDRKARVPAAALIALRAALWNQLPGMEHKAWEGWHFGLDGRLYHGPKQSYAPADVLALHWKNLEIRALRDEVARLEALAEKLARPSAGHGAANDAAILRA